MARHLLTSSGDLLFDAFTGDRGVDALRLCTYRGVVPIDVAISELRAFEQVGTSDQNDQLVTQDSSPEAKIELFRSLFRGRADVFPVRFESQRTGKSGYSSACANEWVRGVCEKPRIKCADCPNRRFIPVTDEVIRWHLSGRASQGRDFIMGVYPMLQNETCHFLAADFDKENWQEDAGACQRVQTPASSRPGLKMPCGSKRSFNRRWSRASAGGNG